MNNDGEMTLKTFFFNFLIFDFDLLLKKNIYVQALSVCIFVQQQNDDNLL